MPALKYDLGLQRGETTSQPRSGSRTRLRPRNPDVELRIIVTTLGGKVIPLQCFSFVLRHPFAVFVQGPQVVLGEGIALIGCEAPPLCSLSVILRHTLAAGVHEPECVLRLGIALVG